MCMRCKILLTRKVCVLIKLSVSLKRTQNVIFQPVISFILPSSSISEKNKLIIRCFIIKCNSIWVLCGFRASKSVFPSKCKSMWKERKRARFRRHYRIFRLLQCEFTHVQKCTKSSSSLHWWLSGRLRGENCKLLRRERPPRWRALSSAVSPW